MAAVTDPTIITTEEVTAVTTGANEFRGTQTLPPDPVLTEVIRHTLASAAEQMKTALVRASNSPGLYEILDFCTAVYDADARLLGQGQAMPTFLGTMGHCIERSVAAVGGRDALMPGDVLLNTYGYDIGSHPPDSAFVMPAFHDGELIGFATAKAHQADLGAISSYPMTSTDIWQEGLILPGVKIISEGVVDESVHRIILANSRNPVQLDNDMNALLYSLRVGAGELETLARRYGLDRYRSSIEDMFDQAEQFIRTAIEALPDGSCSASSHLDSDGITDEHIPLSLTVEVVGSEVIVDLTEAADQTTGPTNCPLPGTLSGCRLALISVLAPEELINEGHLRPFRVRTRPGSQFHPVAPAPVFLYAWPIHLAVELIYRALARMAPQAVRAGSGGDVCGVAIYGMADDGQPWFTVATTSVGQGAMLGGDGGAPVMFICVSGQQSIPAEVWEAHTPVIVRRYELAEDSGGAGTHRGGLGVHLSYELTTDSMTMGMAERSTSPPWGLFDGVDGEPNRILLNYPDGRVQQVFKGDDIPTPRGTIVDVRSGGGGGWGPPSERSTAAIEHDLREGYITEEASRQDYPHAFARTQLSTKREL